MSLRQQIHYKLNDYPILKRCIKRVYQCFFYSLSSKKDYEGNVKRVSPDDRKHDYFFGYYDKSPRDSTGRYMLCMKANDARKEVCPKDAVEILLIDTEKAMDNPDRFRTLGTSSSWNVQQGCMLQWLGPDFQSQIIYNDFRDGLYVSVILNIQSGEERVIAMPVYSVSQDGSKALSLDFNRLFNLRPGYGYGNEEEKTKGIGLPDAPAIWSVDLSSGVSKPILKYTDFADFNPRPEMLRKDTVHKVNHLMLNPSGTRFMVTYRWFVGTRKYSRLITCNVDGSDMFLLSDNDMVSHCCWKDDEHILAFVKNYDGVGYYEFTDKRDNCNRVLTELDKDGHPSYSPDKKMIVTDTYADKRRMCSLFLVKDEMVCTLARVFEPFAYDNETRCDLHPRWRRDGREICIDAAFEGRRGLYRIDGIDKED